MIKTNSVPHSPDEKVIPINTVENVTPDVHVDITKSMNTTNIKINSMVNLMDQDMQSFQAILYENEEIFENTLKVLNGSDYKAKRAKEVIEMSMSQKYQACKEGRLPKELFQEYLEGTNQKYKDKGATDNIFNVEAILNYI